MSNHRETAMSESVLLNGLVKLRPDDRGQFDELFVMDGQECRVHFEMMSDKTLWIGLYPKGAGDDCVHVTVSARGNLNVTVVEA